MPSVVSTVKPSEFCGTIPESTGSICTKLKALWSLANKVCSMATQFLNEDGSLSDEGKSFFAEVSVPTGSIVFWPLDLAPAGWIAANGSIVSRTTYADLFAKYGIKYGAGDGSTTFGLPDLQRKFPLGSSGSNVSGSTGGAETSTILMANLPSEPAPLGTHMTRFLGYQNASVSDDVLPLFSGIATTVVARSNAHTDHADNVMGDLGIDTPLAIMPPYFSGLWVIKI